MEDSPKKKQILIIDDDKRHNKMMSYMLISRGFEVSYALSGEEGLHNLSSGKIKTPDLILLDIMMPGMNGIETFNELKNDPKFKEVPVIVVTAVSDPTKEEKARNLKAEGYVTKPFIPSDLMAVISKVLET